MVYYVYIDPEVIPAAAAGGVYGLPLLIGILRGFLHNCMIAEFEDYRLQAAIKERVKALPESHDRKVVKSVLSAMAKRNRFVYCLTPNHSAPRADTDEMLTQATAALIDLAILETTPAPESTVPASLEIATLAGYQSTAFESERVRKAGGWTIAPGTIAATAFMDQGFRKAFRFATKIEVCDKLFGCKFGDNYEYTGKQMIAWLSNVIADKDNTEVVFHCGKPDGHRDHHIKTTLAEIRNQQTPGLKMAVQFYDLGPDSFTHLPHDRFILTDQIALSIGRGMDFLDRTTGMARDVTLSIIRAEECQAVMGYYATAKLPLVSI